MTPERFSILKKTLDHRQPDLTVITDQVHKQRNLSAIMRSCDAYGVPEIHTRRTDDLRTFAGVAAGAQKWVKIVRHDSIEEGIQFLQQEKKMKVYAAHLSDQAVPYQEIDFTQPTAILMGSELEGVSEEAANACDGHIVIPMVGIVESFNVSVAAALILSEAHRQRKAAGMYDNRRLSDYEFNHYLFEWGYGRLAAKCRDNGIEYPQLDEHGHLDQQAFEHLRTINTDP